jgi:hypothetical protein
MLSAQPKVRFTESRAWLWAGIWSTLFTGMLLRVLYGQRCFRIQHGDGFLRGIGSAAWVALYLFFLLGNRGRLVLSLSLFLLFLALPHVDSLPQAQAEAETIRELRTLANAAEKARKQNPRGDYPANLYQYRQPSKPLLERYQLDYKSSRSKMDGPVDQFVIEATPLWRDCGFIRSFTVGYDGEIHFTFENRAATKSDVALE